jgi:hypothetical protein
MLVKGSDAIPAGNSSALPETTSGYPQQAPVVEMTPAESEVVTEVTPFLTPDPYPILHGTRINGTPQDSPLDRSPEFEKSYTLGGNAVGLLVNVVEGPLYIVFVVTPNNDCLKDPDSCRGNLAAASGTRPMMTITVRDNQTQEIVAEDGYGGEYSSDTGQYTFTYTVNANQADATSGQSTPGPRYIAIYKEGEYQITIEGNYLSVDLKILTGASPTKLDIGNGDSSATTSTTQPATSSGNPWNQ